MTTTSGAGLDALVNPVWSALRGPHRGFALEPAGDGPVRTVRTVRAVRYRPDVAPFAALADPAGDEESWAQLAALTPRGGRVALVGSDLVPPQGWNVSIEIPGVQMIDDQVAGPDPYAAPGDELVPLGRTDVTDMLALVELTQPGPFEAATVDLGGYLGIRREGRLIAMAGRRMQPPGWVEVSAVCTHPDHRGQGLSRRLITAVVAGIRQDGGRAFLHVAQTNTGATGLYRSMGFAHHADVLITAFRRT